MTIIVSEIVRKISDSVIIPFDCITYGKQMKIELDSLKVQYKKEINDLNLKSFKKINLAIENFTQAATEFHNRISSLDKNE
jgi:hypothetical protein